MGQFLDRLRKLSKRARRPRRWVYVPYDQLTDRVGPLSRTPPSEAGVVLVESPVKAARRPYHRQKLALVLANQRHFALEQARRGVAVRYLFARKGYAAALGEVAREVGALAVMRPAERELREELGPLARRGLLEIVPHEGWLTTREDFEESAGRKPPYRMDRFYRHVRKKSGILMRRGKPEGGRMSFDRENRKPWHGKPPAPEPPRFPEDDIKREVARLVEERFASHPGRVDLGALPATAKDAEALWEFAKGHCLPLFGPYEDAMSVRSRSLFHTRISALLNLHRLLPERVVREAAGLDVPIASREGFVRQVLGWREFVRHVHEATDGFRDLPGIRSPEGAPSFLGAAQPLPPAFWGEPSGLLCLDTVVRDVWEEAYGHHITRLMVLGNLATLLDVSPRELADWFWVAYADAYDWVVEPNVLGMATYAAGDLMTTKPYVSGAPYIDRMSDYCAGCRFDPKRDCPVTRLYWAFLARHRRRLGRNPRMRTAYAALRRRPASRRREDASTFRAVRAALAKGESLA